MKKLLLLTGAVIALGGITSCSDDNVASIDPVTTQAEENTPVSFGTYLGNAKSTRAGATGLQTTEVLQNAGKQSGFGVFAFYTGTQKFEGAANTAESNNNGTLPIDFMNNEQVYYENGGWTYEKSRRKYWPNPTQTAVDATLPQYVSFFAYAPYASNAEMNASTNNYGIKSITQKGTSTTNVGTNIAFTKRSDVMVYYSRTPDANGDAVDLLWGTSGEASNGKPATINDDGASSTQRSNEGRKFTYTNTSGTSTEADKAVNADLTKMQTGGKVEFVFRHALGGFGGAPEGPKNNSGNGLLIDYYADMERGDITGNQTQSAKVDGNTRIFVNWIAIEYMSGNTGDNGKTYKPIPQNGYFDLLTGQWKLFNTSATDDQLGTPEAKDARTRVVYYFSPDGTDPESGSDGYMRYINHYRNDLGATVTVVNKKLNNELGTKAGTSTINDYPSWITNGVWSQQGAPQGVENVAKSLYQDKSSPIFFIPGTMLNVKVVVNYDIVTPDPNINYKDADNKSITYTRAHHIMSRMAEFTNPIHMNRLIALYVHLGLTSVKLDASVLSMSTDKDDTLPSDGTTVISEIQDADISPNEKTPNP